MAKATTALELKLLEALRVIGKDYMTPKQIRKDAPCSGLDYEEYLEMSYENIQAEAKRAIKGVTK